MSVLQISLNKQRDVQLSTIMRADPSFDGMCSDEAFRAIAYKAMDAVVPIESVKLADKDKKI